MIDDLAAAMIHLKRVCHKHYLNIPNVDFVFYETEDLIEFKAAVNQDLDLRRVLDWNKPDELTVAGVKITLKLAEEK